MFPVGPLVRRYILLTPWLRVVNISRVIDWLWNLHRSSYFLSDSTELLGKVKQSYYQRIVQWQYFLQQEGSGSGGSVDGGKSLACSV